MRILQILGVALVIAGVAVLWKRPTYPTRRDVVRIGDFKATVNQEEAVPLWIGAAGVGAGVVLLLAGARRRS
jgi:drug/metabolite transporter (DMT)-like permease